MSVKIVTVYWSHYNAGIDKTEVRCLLEVDTVSDLPGMDDISGYRLTIGCVANIIDTAAVYKINSVGNWYVQEQGTDFYTKSQIDTMMAAKQDLLTFDSFPVSVSDNPVKSGGLYTYFQGVLLNGSKNQCPYNNLTAAAAGTILNDQPISLQPGTYIMTYNFTAATGASSFRFSYNGTSVLALTVNNQATSLPREFTLPSEVNQIRLYTSVANDITNMMIRNSSIPDDTYMPYVPTNRELYEMILAL